MSDTDKGPAPETAPAAPSHLTLVPKADGPAPAHAHDPRASDEPRTTAVSVSRAELFDMLDQLKKLSPCHRDPHKFHQRKDELVARLYGIATAS